MDDRRQNMDGALFVDEEEQDARRPRSKPRRATRDPERAEEALRVTQGILDRMDLDTVVRIRDDEDDVVLDISGEDAGRAIGKKGQTLEALQFLVNKIVNRDPDDRRHIVLDSGNYRERHDNGLLAMAKREAKRAIQTGRIVTLEAMSARDRRVVHVALSKYSGVTTRSEGEGSDRRLQIFPSREGGRVRESRDSGRQEVDRRDRDRRDRFPRAELPAREPSRPVGRERPLSSEARDYDDDDRE